MSLQVGQYLGSYEITSLLQEANGSRFLVMELVEGEILANGVGRGPVPIDEALQMDHPAREFRRGTALVRGLEAPRADEITPPSNPPFQQD